MATDDLDEAAAAIVAMPERFLRLRPGRRYRVKLNDCCVEGHFDAVLVRVVMSRDSVGEMVCDGLEFDTAFIGPDWGQFTVEEIPGA